MARIGELRLQGASEKTYTFHTYERGTSFKALGAVYAISRADEDGHAIVYVGETGDLSTRFDNHHKEACFRWHRADVIAVFVDSLEASRRAVEADLIEFYEPPCNN